MIPAGYAAMTASAHSLVSSAAKPETRGGAHDTLPKIPPNCTSGKEIVDGVLPIRTKPTFGGLYCRTLTVVSW